MANAIDDILMREFEADRRRDLNRQMAHQPFTPMTPLEDAYGGLVDHVSRNLEDNWFKPLPSTMNQLMAEASLGRDGPMVDDEMIEAALDSVTPLGALKAPLMLAMTKGVGKLPMDEASRMARAREMGFDPNLTLYHGSADDITSFDPSWSAMTTGNNPHEAFFFTDVPEVAEDYSRQAFNRRYQDNAEQLIDDGIVAKLPADEGDYDEIYPFVEGLANQRLKTHPSHLAIENPYIKDWQGERINLEEADAIANFVKNGYDESGLIDMDEIYSAARFDPDDVADNLDGIKTYALEEHGLDDISDLEDWMLDDATYRYMQDELGYEPEMPSYDAILHKNVIDDISSASAIPHNQYVVFDPSKIRSTKAAFDPAKKDSSNLLASLAAMGVIPATYAMTREEEANLLGM